MAIEAFDRGQLDGTGIDRITEAEVVSVVRDALRPAAAGGSSPRTSTSCAGPSPTPRCAGTSTTPIWSSPTACR